MAESADTAWPQSVSKEAGKTTDPNPALIRQLKYRAFITYSHQDRRMAEWIHKAIENYRVPKSLVGQPGRDGPIPERLFPVFRDRDELSSAADLSSSILEALTQSAYLIVVCSPAATKSRWVNQEIIEFKRLGRSDRIHGLIISGEPNASEGGCYPAALRFALGTDGKLDQERSVEPLAADTREEADGKTDAKLKLIAGLLGIPFNDLRRREVIAARKRQQKVQLVAGLMVLLVAMATIAGYLAYSNSWIADLRQIPGIRVDNRETTLDLSGWQETTEADIANRIKKSVAVSRNKFTIVRTHEYATDFIHVIGTSSGITPEVSCSGRCRMVPRNSGKDNRAPKEWDLDFDISKAPLDKKIEFEFSVSFWNAFQTPTQWWGGFRVLHPTKSSLYSVQFPETRRPLPETVAYYYQDRQEHRYEDEIRSSVVIDGTGRVAKLTWEVPNPDGDRSYRVKWDWNK